MVSFGTIRRKDIAADGQQRRRYEIDEPQLGNGGSKLAGGILLANALLVLKSVFFSSSSDDARAETRAKVGQGPGEQPQPGVVDRPVDLKLVHSNDDIEEQLEPEDIDEAPVSSGSAYSLRRRQSSEEDARFNAFKEASDTESGSIVLFPTSSNNLAKPIVPDAVQLLETAQKPAAGGSSPVVADTGEASAPPTAPRGDKTVGDTIAEPDERDDDRRDAAPPQPIMNRLPVVAAPVVLSELYVNQSIAIAMTDLLRGASDPDGDGLTVTNLAASSGTIVENADGGWTFTPDPHSLDQVTFTYDISDGEGSVAQTALLDVMELPGQDFFGSEQHDTIIATPGGDSIFSFAGDDTIIAREGNDVIEAGAGNDRIVAGYGDDEIHAGDGDDIVFAGAGDDVVYGGAGDDYISGGDGDDMIFGEEGDDILLAGLGDDDVFGGDGDDTLEGGEGMDLLDGGLGDDDLSGGAGADALFGEAGADVIAGGDGNDFASGGAGDDMVAGGAGDDTIEGDGGADVLHGDDGADTLVGGDGDDILIGGVGDDLLLGDDGNDSLRGDTGDDIAEAGRGSDAVDLGDGDDIAVSVLDDGDDIYDGGAGNDTYDASQALETVVIDLDQGTASSEDFGDDQLIDFENAVGGAGDDVIVANDSANSLRGGGGWDIFVFLHGNSRGSGGHTRDRIEDFEVGDRIDVSLMDGNENEAGLQRLTFHYDQADFDGIGQVLFGYHRDEDRGEFTMIRFNFDDDDESDFEIEVVGRYDFDDDDFIN